MISEIYYKLREDAPSLYATKSFIPTLMKEAVETALST